MPSGARGVPFIAPRQMLRDGYDTFSAPRGDGHEKFGVQ